MVEGIGGVEQAQCKNELAFPKHDLIFCFVVAFIFLKVYGGSILINLNQAVGQIFLFNDFEQDVPVSGEIVSDENWLPWAYDEGYSDSGTLSWCCLVCILCPASIESGGVLLSSIVVWCGVTLCATSFTYYKN